MFVVFVTYFNQARRDRVGVICLSRGQKRELSSTSARFLPKMFYCLWKYTLKSWTTTPPPAYTVGLCLWRTTVRHFLLKFLFALPKKEMGMD